MSILPDDFLTATYSYLNPDLKNMSDEDLKYHYLNYGQYEEYRFYKIDKSEMELLPKDFNIDMYRGLNPDIENLNDLQLVRHYIHHGILEKRKYNDKHFDSNFFYDKHFDCPFLIENLNKKDYSLYLEDIRRPKNNYFKELVENYILKEKPYYIFLVNHSDTLYGANHYTYQLFLTLKSKSYFNVKIKLCDFEYNMLLDEKYGIKKEDVIEYKDDPTLLYMYYIALKPRIVYFNSCNFAYTKLYKFIHPTRRILHTHEIFDHYLLSKEVVPDLVVSNRIKKQYEDFYGIQIKTNIQPPFFKNLEEIILLSEEVLNLSSISNSFQLMDSSKITIGMCGQITNRKNYKLFIKISEIFPEINFLWIGDKSNIFQPYKNIFHIQETTNPYNKYRQAIDYFILFSEIDPCPYVIIENILLETKIITFQDNIYYEHKDPLIDPFYISCEGSVSYENVMSAISKYVKEKRQYTLSGNGEKYIKQYFNYPHVAEQLIETKLRETYELINI